MFGLSYRLIQLRLFFLFFFFFQAEDGIRDYKVTGVQTCALPICGFGELIDIGPGTRAGRFAGNRGNDLGVVDLGHPDRKSVV